MENASKALLMAAGVLIGVAVLTLAVYLYTSFSGTAQSVEKDIEQGQLQQFNNQFIEFSAKECTISDILNCINLANDYNKKNEFTSTDTNYYISVRVGTTPVNNVTNTVLKNILKIKKTEKTDYAEITDDELKLYKFTCTIGYSDETGRVNQINFTKSKN